jgi:hypothetical protein
MLRLGRSVVYRLITVRQRESIKIGPPAAHIDRAKRAGDRNPDRRGPQTPADRGRYRRRWMSRS